MNFLPNLDQLKGVWEGVAANAITFEAPVPDTLLLAGFLVALAAQRTASKQTFQRVQGLYHDAYNGEILNANRKAYQARSELDRAQKEIERSRQKERRAKREAEQVSAKPEASEPPKDVVVMAKSQSEQPDAEAMPVKRAAPARQTDETFAYDKRQHADAVIQLSENLKQLSLNKGADQ